MDTSLDTLPCGHVAFADDGTIVAANATLAGWLGYAQESLPGRSVETLLTLAARIFFQTHLFPMLSLHGQADEVFVGLRTAEGDEVPVLTNAARHVENGQAVSHCIFLPVRQRQRYEDEIRQAQRTAEEALRTNSLLKDTQQQLEVQTRELDRQVSRLQQRSSELSRLSSILAHDLREPSRKISLFTGVLLSEKDEALSDNARWAVRTLATESARLTSLLSTVQQFLSVAADELPFEPVDLNGVVQAACGDLNTATEDGPLALDCGPLPVIAGRQHELELLFRHLLANAVQFRTPGTPPQVRIEAQVVQRNSFRAMRDRYHYVDYAQIVVADNGPGFDDRYRAQLFVALKKLDPHSPGFGMGLAICKKIVDNHFGHIEASGTPGQGARFTILLPVEQA